MDTIGLDLHKRESQLCVLTEAGEIVERRIVTSRERFTAVLGSRVPARILLEAATESEWVARHLESLGHEVIVADPNCAPMYATRRRGVKTDRRDARTLAEACRLGAYRAIHRASATQRHVRAQLAVRDALIRTRTRYVSVVRALTRRDGLRLASGGPAHLEAKLAALPLTPALQAEIAPLRVVLDPLTAQITAADAQLAAMAQADPVVERLRTAPGIGPVTAVAFVATLDVVTRFGSAHQVAAYLGPAGVQLRRAAAPRADQQDGQPADAGAAGRGGVARAALHPGHCRAAAGVGRADRAPPRPQCGRGRAGAAVGGHPLRHVARRDGLPRAPATGDRRGVGIGLARRV